MGDKETDKNEKGFDKRLARITAVLAAITAVVGIVSATVGLFARKDTKDAVETANRIETTVGGISNMLNNNQTAIYGDNNTVNNNTIVMGGVVDADGANLVLPETYAPETYLEGQAPSELPPAETPPPEVPPTEPPPFETLPPMITPQTSYTNPSVPTGAAAYGIRTVQVSDLTPLYLTAGVRAANAESSNFVKDVMAEQGDIVTVSMTIRNLSGEELFLGVWAALPEGLSYVEGSTRLYTGAGVVEMGDITAHTVDIGAYGLYDGDMRGWAIVEFQVMVDAMTGRTDSWYMNMSCALTGYGIETRTVRTDTYYYYTAVVTEYDLD